MLRYIAVVLILLAAVAAAGAADVRALVAFVLFAQLTRLAVARRRADRAVAERRPAADVMCCDPPIDDIICGSAILHGGATREEMVALLRALEDEAARADERPHEP